MSVPFLPFCRPDIDDADISAVVDVLKSGWITTGPRCADLENAFGDRLGCSHAVAVGSATAGMHLHLHALGIGPGDEVITPSMTWVSTVNLIRLLGAEPVFADVDADTLMVTAAEIESLITERTRALIPVHFAGAPLDLAPLRALAARHDLPLIEDAAHALGSKYRDESVGSEGTAIFSLQAIKNVTGAEGGVLVTDDPALAERVRRLRFHGLGMDSHERQRQGRAPQAEVLEPGFKYNLPDLCAALAHSQLRRLEEINARRQALADQYLDRLADLDEVRPLSVPQWPHHHAWHLMVVRITSPKISRDAFIEEMNSRGIGCGIHFRAVHLQRYYRELAQTRHQNLPNTRWNSDRICSLPLFPAMTSDDVERVVLAMKAVLAS